MSAIDTPRSPGHPQDRPGAAGDNYLTHGRGLRSWIFSLDHKRIGVMYLWAILFFFFVGGLFAVMLRTELISPRPTLVSDAAQSMELYNHTFTIHGAVMVFLFIIPAIPSIIGNFVLPMMLGARDMAFPRLNLASLWLYFFGSVFFVWVLLGGVLQAAGVPVMSLKESLGWFGWLIQPGLDTGWTFYTPYSTSRTATGVVPATFGAFIIGFSSILTAVNFIATIHMLRPRNMTWFRMPLLLWALYATAIIIILATPVLAITLLLLIAERVLQVGIFDSTLGGDPVLYQHFFWFYSHPAVYIMILPAMGVISELISTHSRRHIFGYKFIAFSSIAIALLSFLVWGHHMFVSGQSALANAIFSLLTFSVSIPSAIKVFNWLSTMYKGNIRFTTPLIYALGFLVLFTFGGLTGLFLGALSTDIYVTATYFIVAHFHYVMVGSVLFAFLGGIYHWWPKMFGVMPDQRWGNIASIVTFIGFNLTFLVQFIAGSLGMPRRYASYPEQYTPWMVISTLGAYVMTIGLFMVLWNLWRSFRHGKPAAANPWGANSLEWHTPSPPRHDNFPVTPDAGDPYDFHRWQQVGETDEWIELPEDQRPAPAHAH